MSSRLRAATVTVLAILVLAAGALPACAAEECCAKTHDTNIHRDMECCKDATIDAGEIVHLLPATPAVPQAALPVATIEPPLPLDIPTAHVIVSFAGHEPDPPLFLLNEQFRI